MYIYINDSRGLVAIMYIVVREILYIMIIMNGFKYNL